MRLGDEAFIYENSEEHYGMPVLALTMTPEGAWRIITFEGDVLGKEDAERVFAFGCLIELREGVYAKPIAFERGGVYSDPDMEAAGEPPIEKASAITFYNPIEGEFQIAWTAGMLGEPEDNVPPQ